VAYRFLAVPGEPSIPVFIVTDAVGQASHPVVDGRAARESFMKNPRGSDASPNQSRDRKVAVDFDRFFDPEG
jgi:hypothetical protein